MTKANKFIGTIVKQFKENQIIENKYICELIQHHPTKHIDVNRLEWLKMMRKPPYNTLALCYKCIDEQCDFIAWKLCIRNVFGKYDGTRKKLDDIKKAFRTASNFGSKFDYLKNNTAWIGGKRTGVCKNCSIETTHITVDHYPKPYVQILDGFKQRKQIRLCDVNSVKDNYGARILDTRLANE